MAVIAKPNPVDPATSPGAPSEEEAPGKAAAAPLTRDDISGIVRETATAVAESMRAVVQSALRPSPAPPPEATVPDVSDDDINAAIASGEQPARLVRRLAEAAATRAARELRDKEVTPFRNTGTAAMAKLVERQAIALMPHYTRFKPQIDATFAQMRQHNPEALLDIDNLLHVHNLIVGQNVKALEEEWKEEALRKPAADDSALAPTHATGRRRPPEKPSALEDVLPDSAISALDDLGQKGRGGRPVGKSFDEFVASLPPYETTDEHGRKTRKRWTADEYMAELARGGVETEGEA